MRREELENGAIRFHWTGDERNQKRAFEECLLDERAANVVLSAAMKAIKETIREKNLAWQSMFELIGLEPETHILSYDWIQGYIRVERKDA